VVRISRQSSSLTFPADFLLVACSNHARAPATAEVLVQPGTRARYRRRLVGPLLDRFDVRMWVGPPEADDVAGDHQRPYARACTPRPTASTTVRGVRWRRNGELPAPVATPCRTRRAAESAWRQIIDRRALTVEAQPRSAVSRERSPTSMARRRRAEHSSGAMMRQDVP